MSSPGRPQHVVLLTLLVIGLALWSRAPRAGGQDAPPQRAAPQAWEYDLLAWTPADTLAVLRGVTGDDLGAPEELARSLARETDLLDHPAVRAAVQVRLAERLDEAGREGWEAFWIREETVVVGGTLMPAPTALLKRPR